MRCQKCGYTGFDFVAECKKCGADLAALREELGFIPVKPEIPYLLEALRKSQDVLVESGMDSRAHAEPGEMSLPEIEFGDELEGFSPGGPPAAETGALSFGAPQGAIPEADGPLELTDDDLNRFLQDESEGLELLLDDELLMDTAPDANQQGAGAVSFPDEDGFTLELEDVGDLDLSSEIRKSSGQPEGTQAGDQTDEDLVIEVSDEDLEELLLELGEPTAADVPSTQGEPSPRPVKPL